MASVIIGDYEYQSVGVNVASASVVDKTKSSYGEIRGSVDIDGSICWVTYLINCFSGCTSLTEAPVIPSGVTNMGSCFYNCTSLTQAPEIPSSVTNLAHCFAGCTSLTEAPVIPSSVTSMGSCFYNCTSLTQAPVIPSGVTYLASCFSGCTSLTEAPVIPSSVTNMGGCFRSCTSLTQAPVIPSSVTNMSYCFRSCTSLTQAPEIPSSVENMAGCFRDCTSLTQAPEIPSSVTSMIYCFYNCTSLTEAPEIPSSVIGMDSTFWGCTSLAEAPVIPNSVTSMSLCFYNCASLTQAPVIPSSVRNVSKCFKFCTSLIGNVEVENTPTYYDGIFDSTRDAIFIVDNGDGENVWRDIASGYANVHYEADDNPIPNISNFTATRVSAVGSTDYEPTGTYAYIKATAMVYDNLIPVGWTNELKGEILTDNGTVESVTWQPSQITEYPTDIWCWISLGDTSGHTITLQISDSIKDNGTEVKTQSSSVLSKTITKSYALVDYYHDDVTGTEGMSIGKYAEYPDLLDVDMPTLFRQGFSLVDGESVIRTILDYMRPIGSTYSTIDSTFDPNDVWGGTWVKLPEGYVLLSGSESGSYIVGTDTSKTSGFKEYGENTHTLTKDEMPAHTHTQDSHNHTLGDHSHSVQRALGVTGSGTWAGENGGALSGSSYKYAYTQVKGTAVSTVTATGKNNGNTGGKVATNQNTGGDKAHSIMQKSIAVYWWIRTA